MTSRIKMNDGQWAAVALTVIVVPFVVWILLYTIALFADEAPYCFEAAAQCVRSALDMLQEIVLYLKR